MGDAFYGAVNWEEKFMIKRMNKIAELNEKVDTEKK